MKKLLSTAAAAAICIAFASPASAHGCVDGIKVTYSNDEAAGVAPGTATNYQGRLMREGMVAFNDLNAFPDGSRVTFPEVYGDTIFPIGDHATAKNTAVIWKADNGVGKTVFNTRMCPVD